MRKGHREDQNAGKNHGNTREFSRNDKCELEPKANFRFSRKNASVSWVEE
jgi:hypothetical protein